MSRADHLHCFFVVLILCLSLIAGAGVGGAAPTDGRVFQQSPPGSSNVTNGTDTPRHQDPATVEGESDLGTIKEWLASELAASLGEGAGEISADDFEAVDETLGAEYNARLSRYADIAEATSQSQANVELFRRTAENERRFADLSQEYRTTYDEYQAARQAGDEQRARELARELERTERNINELGRELERNFQNITDSTTANLSEQRQAIENQREAIAAQHSQIQGFEFVETELMIEPTPEPRAISSIDPLSLTGQLTTAEGEPIAYEEVAFTIGSQTVTTTTDSTGAFTLTYRPTTLSANTTSMKITYEPDASSRYASSNATVPVSVEQTTPQVTIDTVSNPIAYGQTMEVTGSVGVDGIGTGGVPVIISVGGQRFGEITTGPDGTFTFTATVPSTIPPGPQQVQAHLPLENQALRSATTTAPTTVEQTNTQIGMTATRTDTGQIAISGRLATADNRAIEDQPVRILIDGTPVRTVQTDDTGGYAATIKPTSVIDGTAGITVVYDGTGTNLADAQASTTVTGLPIAPALLDRLWGPGLIPVGIGLVVLMWAYRYRRNASTAEEVPSIGDRTSETENSEPESYRIPAPILLEHAHEARRDGDTDRAVNLAYAAVRSHLGTDAMPSWTHWEFYNETADDLEKDERYTLLSITEQFERAIFTSEAIPQHIVTEVLTAADQLIDRSESEDDFEDGSEMGAGSPDVAD